MEKVPTKKTSGITVNDELLNALSWNIQIAQVFQDISLKNSTIWAISILNKWTEWMNFNKHWFA